MSSDDAEAVFELNGLDIETGRLMVRLSQEELRALALGERIEPEYFEELRGWREAMQDQPFDVCYGVDVKDLKETGWAVLWTSDLEPGVKEALKPLVDLRREQAGDLFQELTVLPGQDPLDFLALQGLGPSPATPLKLPYYLLIVGSPEQISFSFQYRLDVQYAVGRIHFGAVEDYARYAESVVQAESRQAQRRRQLTLFGVSNPGDSATRRCRRDLVEPLAKIVDAESEWLCDVLVGDQATKNDLQRVLASPDLPAILLTGSHGAGLRLSHERQREDQGALVCQDWPGPNGWDGPLTADHLFRAEDLSESANVAGLIMFIFACFGAGTPKHEEHFAAGEKPNQLAEEGFIASLPQRLLSHPRGGALAVIGHVERAWTYSFSWPGAGAQREVFVSTLRRLMNGYPVGAAMEHFGQRFAELAVDVAVHRSRLLDTSRPKIISSAAQVLAFKDARSYVVIGDPAVRVAIQPAAAGAVGS